MWSLNFRDIKVRTACSLGVLLTSFHFLMLGHTHKILPIGLVFMSVLLFLYTSRGSFSISTFAWVGIVALSMLLTFYEPGAFIHPVVFEVDALYSGGKPYSLFLNAAKWLIGVILFIWLVNHTRERRLPSIAWSLSVASVAVIMTVWAGVAALDLSWALKISEYTLLFALVNLFVTCFTEQVFYRWLVQDNVARVSKYHGPWLGVFVSTLVFIATHPAPTDEIFLVTGVAGLCYAMVYAITGRLWLTILAHFTVNMVHFMFLEFPF